MATATATAWKMRGVGYEFCNCDFGCGCNFGGFPNSADGSCRALVGMHIADGAWQLRLWWKPFVTLIWLGGVLVALGGFLALLGRALRGWRPGVKRERYA